MKRAMRFLPAAMLLFACAAPLGARLRMAYDDEEVAARSEVIAVALEKIGDTRANETLRRVHDRPRKLAALMEPAPRNN